MTHASQHTDLADFSGRRVVVVGGGQSALETAALLHETGADVQVAVRKPAVAWNARPLDPHRPLLQRLRDPRPGRFRLQHLALLQPPGAVPPPAAVHPHLPGPDRPRACASWLQGRVEGEFPVLTGHNVRSARVDGEGIRITLAGSGGEREVTADHLIAATGYRPDLGCLRFIGDSLRPAIRTVAKTPAVDKDYQSSVPGLYFAGPGVAPTFGPVMPSSLARTTPRTRLRPGSSVPPAPAAASASRWRDAHLRRCSRSGPGIPVPLPPELGATQLTPRLRVTSGNVSGQISRNPCHHDMLGIVSMRADKGGVIRIVPAQSLRPLRVLTDRRPHDGR